MEIYVIVPRAGTYRVMAAAADGTRELVATYPTEQAAMRRLKALQEKAGVTAAGTHHFQYGRLA